MSDEQSSRPITVPRSKAPSGGIQQYPGETEERAIVRSFMNILRAKAQWMTSDSTIMDTFDKTIRSPPYTAERRKITEINNDMGLWKGVALGVGTFIFLRSGPRIIRWWLTPRTNRLSATYTLDRNPYSYNTSSSSSSSSSFSSTEPTGTPTGPSLFWRVIKLGIDSFVSVSMAAWGSLYFMNTQEMIQSITKIPLLEGKSLVSQLLCDDFIDLYQSIPRRKWDNYTSLHQQIEAMTGQKSNLMMIQDFVINCIKRKTFEKQLCLELSTSSVTTSTEVDGTDSSWLDKNRTDVEIPSPGVPEDVEIIIEWKDQDSDEPSSEDDDVFSNDSSF